MVAHRKYHVEIGQQFGWGTVIDPDLKLSNGRGALLRCRCGNEYSAYFSNLKIGNNKSCGCAKKVTSAENGRKTAHLHVTHGLSDHYLYNTWIGIKDRCCNEESKDYVRYGARGIQMNPEWYADVSFFISWIESNLGPRPVDGSVDRINNDGNYEPGNIRWATPQIQRANQRKYNYGEKTCAGCQNTYGATGPAQRYCSSTCRERNKLK